MRSGFGDWQKPDLTPFIEKISSDPISRACWAAIYRPAGVGSQAPELMERVLDLPSKQKMDGIRFLTGRMLWRKFVRRMVREELLPLGKSRLCQCCRPDGLNVIFSGPPIFTCRHYWCPYCQFRLVRRVYKQILKGKGQVWHAQITLLSPTPLLLASSDPAGRRRETGRKVSNNIRMLLKRSDSPQVVRIQRITPGDGQVTYELNLIGRNAQEGLRERLRDVLPESWSSEGWTCFYAHQSARAALLRALRYSRSIYKAHTDDLRAAQKLQGAKFRSWSTIGDL